MTMNMKQLKYVLVLAEQESFSRAADTLNISQPSLSQYIKKIEKEIGTPLFYRTGNSFRLTDAGAAYLKIGRQMLDLEHQLDAELADLAAFRTGTITVGIAAHRSISLMPEIVKSFKAQFPGIVVRVEERKRHEIIDAAEHGEFDLCITTLPVDRQTFFCETVLVEENVIALPAQTAVTSRLLPNRKFPAIPVSALENTYFAMLNDEHPMQRELAALCEQHQLHLTKAVECTGLSALLEMVKVGVGAAYVPSCIAKPQPDVQFFSLEEETARREIVMIWRKEQYQSHSVQALADLIRKQFGKL